MPDDEQRPTLNASLKEMLKDGPISIQLAGDDGYIAMSFTNHGSGKSPVEALWSLAQRNATKKPS